MSRTLLQEARALQKTLSHWRRHFHKHPELMIMSPVSLILEM